MVECPARVVIVEDDVSLRGALARVLRGHDLVLVATAAEGLEALASRPTDALLTDYGLAIMDGLALLREVAITHPSVNRYLMSGFDEGRFRDQLATGLIRRLFPKPVDIQALRAEFDRLLSAR